MEDNKSLDQNDHMFTSNEETQDETVDAKKPVKKGFKQLISKLLVGDEEVGHQAEEGEKKHRIREALVNLLGFSDIITEPDYLPEPFENLADQEVESFPVEESKNPITPGYSTAEQNYPLTYSNLEMSTKSETQRHVKEEDRLDIELPQPDIQEAILPKHDELMDSGSAQYTRDFINSSPRSERIDTPATETQGRKIESYPPKTSSGAALLGFVAAETLSRHRDAKIRKEAASLKDHVEKQDKYHTTTEFSLEERVAHNKEQLEKLRHKRSEVEPQIPPRTTERESLRTSVPNPELARSKVNEVIIERRVPDVQVERSVPGKMSETPEANQYSSGERLILDQVENAAEHDIAIEAYYERMHEAKDVPTGTTGSGGGMGGSSYQKSEKNSSIGAVSINPKKSSTHDNTKNDELYLLAAKRGAITGVMLLLGFLVVALIWSLLR